MTLRRKSSASVAPRSPLRSRRPWRGRNRIRADLKAFAVHINRTPQQPWPGYGVYLGNGLILTAAHVAGNVAQTKPHVVIAGQDLPAALVKQGSLDSVDLTLLSIDGTKLPVGLQMRRMPLCEHPPFRWREGRRRHSRGNGPLEDPASSSDPGRPARAVRHRRSPMSPPPGIPARGCLTPPICACWGS